MSDHSTPPREVCPHCMSDAIDAGRAQPGEYCPSCKARGPWPNDKYKARVSALASEPPPQIQRIRQLYVGYPDVAWLLDEYFALRSQLAGMTREREEAREAIDAIAAEIPDYGH